MPGVTASLRRRQPLCDRDGIRRLGEVVAERFGTEHEFVDVPNPIRGAAFPRILRPPLLTHPRQALKLANENDGRRQRVAIHLTPTELAEEVNMKRREVISKCMEMGVPIFNGRIDKTLFLSSLRRSTDQAKQPQTAA
jgi:hypothetical protein